MHTAKATSIQQGKDKQEKTIMHKTFLYTHMHKQMHKKRKHKMEEKKIIK